MSPGKLPYIKKYVQFNEVKDFLYNTRKYFDKKSSRF